MTPNATEVRPGPEGGGAFAPALGGGSGANRVASAPVEDRENTALQAFQEAPDRKHSLRPLTLYKYSNFTGCFARETNVGCLS